MRPYETLVVLSTSLGGEKQALIDRLHGVVKERGGTIDVSHDWGQRRLAYPIKKQSDGHYFLIEYQAEPDAVSELERTLRIADGVLRYLTVQQEHTGLPKPREREVSRSDPPPLHEMHAQGGHSAGGAGDTLAAEAVVAAGTAASEADVVQTPAVTDARRGVDAAAEAPASTAGEQDPVRTAPAEPADAAEDSEDSEDGPAEVAAAASDDGVKNDE